MNNMYNNPEQYIDFDDREANDESYYLNAYFGWKSPSNLAIIKYWGKHGLQLPQNPSISLTLSEAYTETHMEVMYRDDTQEWVTFLYDDVPQPAFAKRVETFLKSIIEIFPFIEQYNYVFNSRNTFPHSSGIASSASAFSAIALCICDMEKLFFDTLQSDEEFYRKASFISRLGSGSACRSVYRSWTEWGQHEANEKFSDYYATPLVEIHESFKTMNDTILIASTSEKSVSSSAGHKLMENNVYAEPRFQQAKDRIPILLKALKDGDWETFGKIAENEAMTLHALMMSSEDSYILMEPNTIEMIRRIREYREETGHHVYFSLDAGPNIHLLYPESIEKEIHQFINAKMLKLCQNKTRIYDKVGYGPEKIEHIRFFSEKSYDKQKS